MDEKVILKSILKKRTNQLVKPFRLTRLTKRQLEEIRIESDRLRALLSVFESYFSKRAHLEANPALEKMSLLLEEVRSRNVSVYLLARLAEGEQNVGKRNGVGRGKPPANSGSLLEEAKMRHDHSVLNAVRELKRVRPRKIEKILLEDFKPEADFALNSLVKILNERRERLFNQIVEIIRTSQKEAVDELRVQVEEFYYLLEFAVDAGYQKGKRLLKIVKLLRERLTEVYDEETFRQFVQDLEREKANHSDTVADVGRLRAIRNRLGIFQAHALQALHAHLPASLQVLKRELIWI